MKSEHTRGSKTKESFPESQESGTPEKPDYGYVALKYFLRTALVGVFGLVLVVISLPLTFIFWPGAVLLFIIGLPIAFVGLYIGAAYIPMHFLMLRPRIQSDLWRKITKSEGLRGNEVVLDLGCGTGSVAIKLAKELPTGRIFGIDIFEGMSATSPEQARRNAEIEGVSDRVQFGEGNLLDIPFPDNSFDLVTAGSVLHEIHSHEDRVRALRQIDRVLKPGGKFIMIELLRDLRMFVMLLLFGFVWKPRSYWLDLLESSGFRNLKVKDFRQLLNVGLFVAEKEHHDQ